MTRVVIDRRKLDDLIRNTPRRADAWLREVTIEMVADIQNSFGTSPPGREYPRGEGKVHIASRPGYPPSVDVGTLRASITWMPMGRLHTRIQDGVEYGLYLEDGTETIAPRPFIAPVFEEWRTRKLAASARRSGVFD